MPRPKLKRAATENAANQGGALTAPKNPAARQGARGVGKLTSMQIFEILQIVRTCELIQAMDARSLAKRNSETGV